MNCELEQKGNVSENGSVQTKRCRLVCITPTRNESWIIKEFLAAARSWADHVIVADQRSTDGTWQILTETNGVTPVENTSEAYDESYRQKLLIRHAREIPGKRILIALDADEVLSANYKESAEWQAILDAKPGTVLRFRWVNILPGFERAWISPEPVPLGFVDDGSEHTAQQIHSRRIPWPAEAPVLDLKEIVVLHLQYVFWERMASKRRWYQAWEHVKHQKKSPLQIFREYNHMEGGWGSDEIHPVKEEWLNGYDARSINLRALRSEEVTWWDQEIIQMLVRYGTQKFRKIAIWDKDWNQVAKKLGCEGRDFQDPRAPWDRLFHKLLAATQKNRATIAVRVFEFLLRRLGW